MVNNDRPTFNTRYHVDVPQQAGEPNRYPPPHLVQHGRLNVEHASTKASRLAIGRANHLHARYRTYLSLVA